VLEELFSARTVSEWEELLAAADVPHAPVLAYAGIAEHPQFLENGYIQEIEHPNLGHMRVHGPPVHMSKTPPGVQGGGPELGQHTEELLLEAGYSWEELEALHRSGVISPEA
jgi:crotonobetainyl-CoA:carnitine CoA-transferase CaiB-like acyl-CoA transferase